MSSINFSLRNLFLHLGNWLFDLCNLLWPKIVGKKIFIQNKSIALKQMTRHLILHIFLAELICCDVFFGIKNILAKKKFYQCCYLHTLRESVSPVCRIISLYLLNIYLKVQGSINLVGISTMPDKSFF